MRYQAYGLVLESDFDLPIPTSVGGSCPDVRLRRRPVDDTGVHYAPVQVSDGDDDVWIELGWRDDGTILRFTDGMAQLVDDRIDIDIDTDDTDYLTHLALDHIVPRWLSRRGDLVLHAGAIMAPNGRAVALIGDPGQGKSTMVTAMGQAGWSVLADDACRLVEVGAVWFAYPSYPGTRLLPDSRSALVPAAPSTPMARGSDKHRVPTPGLHTGAPAPLGLIVELGDESVAARVRSIPFALATASLVRHSFFLAPKPDELALRAFDLASRLAADVPVFRLEFPRRWDVYAEVADLLHQFELVG